MILNTVPSRKPELICERVASFREVQLFTSCEIRLSFVLAIVWMTGVSCALYFYYYTLFSHSPLILSDFCFETFLDVSVMSCLKLEIRKNLNYTVSILCKSFEFFSLVI